MSRKMTFTYFKFNWEDNSLINKYDIDSFSHSWNYVLKNNISIF